MVGAIDALLDRMEPNGSADLNVEFFSAIPLLTITGSFGVSVGEALDIREAVTSDGLGIEAFTRIVPPIVAARREEPRDDLISVLVAAEITEEDGSTHRLTDEEVLIFAFILLAAGSGTTWKQMGITMLALFDHPDVLAAVRDDRDAAATGRGGVAAVDADRPDVQPLRQRATPTSPASTCPRAPSCTCAWPRPTATRRGGSARTSSTPGRPVQPHMGFGTGAHICLGMHVARAELVTAIGALLDRLPDLRLDPDAPAPRITGMYERGPTSVPVRF